jgi:hypothetical protein
MAGLNATFQQQHLARVRARRLASKTGVLPALRHLGLSAPPGSSGRTSWPSAMAGANSGEGRPSFSAQRSTFSLAGRGTFWSTILRPISSRCPYCTPLGQVVSQLRQVRQRSRCIWVLRVGFDPFEHLLHQVDATARGPSSSSPSSW